MDLRKQKASDRIEMAVRGTNSGKGSNYLYQQKIVQDAISGASKAFQDRIRGKTDRENGPDSPMTSLIKRSIKQKNVFK